MMAALGAAWPLLLALFVLLCFSAFFSGAETAIFSVGPSDERQASRRGGVLLRTLMERRAQLLVTILLGNLLVNILFFNLGSLLAFRLETMGASSMASVLPLVLLLIIVTFAEVLPKTMAVSRARTFALLVGRPLLVLERLLLVPRAILASVANAFGRLLLGQRQHEGDITSEELEGLLDLAAREGQIAADESERLQSLLILSRLAVHEIMVPRVAIVAFRLVEGRDRFLELAKEHRRNKVLVYQSSVDEVEGFLDVKQVLTRPDTPLDVMVHPVGFVPEVAQVSQLMDRFLEEEQRIMVVVDEYGGTAGVVTLEDLVEAFVGDLHDESDKEVPVEILGPGHYRVSSGLKLRSWKRIHREHREDLPVVTVGGLVTALLGRLPHKGDTVQEGPARFTVVSMRHRRADRIEVRIEPRRENTA